MFNTIFTEPKVVLTLADTRKRYHQIMSIEDHTNQHTEVRIASFLSGEFTTMAVINQPEKKQAKRTSVLCLKNKCALTLFFLGVVPLFSFFFVTEETLYSITGVFDQGSQAKPLCYSVPTS